MTRYLFTSQVVLNTDGTLGAGLDGQAFAGNVGTPEYTSDLLAADGVSPASFVTDSTGVPPWVYGPDGVTTLWLSFAGGPRFDVHATDVTEEMLQKYVAGTLGGSTSTTVPTHTEPVAQLTGNTGQALSSTVVSLLNAADAAAIRSAAGAAPSSLVGFPGFGLTSTTAKRGDWTPTAGQVNFTPSGTITATDVQTAIVQAAASGPTTGGSGDEFSVYYSGGAYPSSAASPPAGTKRRHFYGPSAYLGATINGILDLYTPTGPTPLGT